MVRAWRRIKTMPSLLLYPRALAVVPRTHPLSPRHVRRVTIVSMCITHLEANCAFDLSQHRPL